MIGCRPATTSGLAVGSRGRLIVTVLVAALAGCSSNGATTSTTGEPSGSGDTSATSLVTPAPLAPFFLDLRTGTQSSLPSMRTEDGAAFDDGYYYVPSPDGSSIYWESPGMTASLVAKSDGSEVRRLDPTGAIDDYAGGWSPDGSKIVYQRRDSSGDDFGNLVVEDLESGR